MDDNRAEQEAGDLLRKRLDALGPSLSPLARKVATYIDRNRVRALAGSAADIAAAIGTSDATVVRTVQALGFTGLAELRSMLAASLDRAHSTPAEELRRTLADARDNAEQAIDHVLDTHRDAIESLRAEPARGRFTEAVSVLHGAARIVTFGIGPSAALARYVAALLARTGRAARVLDATGSGLADQLLDLRAGDAVLMLAYGRAYREATVVFAEAARQQLPVVLVTDSLEVRLRRQAAVVIPAPRGREDRVALHGATLVALEALVLGLAASDRARAVESLDRLSQLRAALVAGKD